MEIKAFARNVRMSPRKVRLVSDLVKGLSVENAVIRLSFIVRDAAVPVRKVIESAAANAEHNFKLDRKNLYVKSIFADGGPTIKRWSPRARGSSALIRKRTAHISVILAERGV